MKVLTDTTINVTFHIDLEFYYNEYDWGIIYRYLGRQQIKTIRNNVAWI